MGAEKEVVELRTKQINDFMSSFDSLNEVDTEVIMDGLQRILGEKPGVDFEYGADVMINEATKEKTVKRELKKIHVYYTYTDEEGDLRVSKISYIVD